MLVLLLNEELWLSLRSPFLLAHAPKNKINNPNVINFFMISFLSKKTLNPL